MKIRCMTVQSGNLWVAMSLEFGLAAQADTELEAKQKLIAQIEDYIEEANADGEYRDYWLNRKASWGFYVLYYWLEFKGLWKKDNSVFQFTDAHAV